MEKLFDETIRKALKAGLVSVHASADGTLVRANASYKSFAPIEVALSREEFNASIRAEDREYSEKPLDKGIAGRPRIRTKAIRLRL